MLASQCVSGWHPQGFAGQTVAFSWFLRTHPLHYAHHEVALTSVQEGFEKAVAYLKTMLIKEKAGEAWWF